MVGQVIGLAPARIYRNKLILNHYKMFKMIENTIIIE